MKKFKIAAVTVGMLFAATAANAADGTITFEGEILNETCKIVQSDINKLVKLPKIAANSFKNVGDVNGTQRFSISVVDCPVSLNKVAIHLESTGVNSGINMVTGNLKNDAAGTTAANNIEVTMFDRDTNVQVVPAQTGRFYDIVNQAATMNFIGAYYATAIPVRAGIVNAKVSYTLAYP